MNSRPLVNAVSIACLCAGALACDPPEPNEPPPLRVIEKSSALAAANANLRSILIGSAQSSAVASRSAILDDIAMGSGECSTSGECFDSSLESDADETAREIAERVLNVANIEIEEEKRIVLKLIPERVCAEASGVPDAECVRVFTEVPVRIELTSRVENDIDIALLIDDA